MKKIAVILLSLIFCAASIQNVEAQQKRDILQHIGTQKNIDSLCQKKYTPYPPYSDREYWQKHLEPLRSQIIDRAEKGRDYIWKSVTATSYLDYSRLGIRRPNDEHIAERYVVLSNLILGELLDGTGRYMDAIIDGTWALCEQTSWVAVAHLFNQGVGGTLPVPNKNGIDLSAGKTASTMAWVYYFFKKELDRQSPIIAERMRNELNKRVLDVYLNKNDIFWLGFKEGQQVNNWNPWCNFNVLTTALLIEDNAARRAEIVKKTMRSVDQFINFFKDDGGCEEGPSYWAHAAGMLNNYLEMVRDYTGGQIDVFDQQIVKNIGLYITRAHIDSLYFVNFADASAFGAPVPEILYRYGRNIGDTTFMRFAAHIASLNGFAENSLNATFNNQIKTVDIYSDLLATTPAAPLYQSVWMDGVEVVVARTSGGQKRGMTFAAKGGYNAESHNHNDVGSFILYLDGEPMVIDAGVGTYTASTFDRNRYSIWTMQSAYHNLPIINGAQQAPGSNMRSKDVRFADNGSKMEFSMDIADAYPDSAACKSWVRKYGFNRKNGSLIVSDAYSLKEVKGNISSRFLTIGAVNISRPGVAVITSKGKTLEVVYNASVFDLSLESVAITDPSLAKSWKNDLTVLNFRVKQPKLIDELEIKLTQK